MLALLVTVLGSLKPMHIDETAYYYYAAQIAEHPLDPYGFDIFWYQWPTPANQVLAPPGMLYWWALGLRLLRPLGESVLLWKICLLPFTLLFAFSLDALFRRFCRGLDRPLLALTILSPAILPGLNLMPDLPALSLSLSAVTIFLHALDRSGGARIGWALLAGLLTGLAMQTKYTAFLTPAVVLLAAIWFGRVWLSLLVILPAVAIFVGWEAVTAYLYGDSHFLLQLQAQQTLGQRSLLALPLLTLAGAVASTIGLLSLAARGASRSVLLGGYAFVGLSYFGITIAGARFGWDIPAGEQVLHISLSDVLYCLGGVLVTIALAVAVWHLWRGPGLKAEKPQDRQVDRFLVLWFGLEVVGYFFLTPFPAVRRVMGLVVVGTLLAGRLAARRSLPPEFRRTLQTIVALGILLGLGYQVVDISEALAAKQAAETAAARIRKQGEQGQVWYVGHWGFQYYAEREGMKPVVPDVSLLRAGDWLVLPDEGVEQQLILRDPERTERAFSLVSDDQIPLNTVRGYYGGMTPLDQRRGPRRRVEVRRVISDFVPASPPSFFP